MRGQVNLLLLALLCGAIAALLRGRRWRAGYWLAGAVCLKVVPVFLLSAPAWRRDVRFLTGSIVGIALGLVVLPAMVMGMPRTVAYYQEYATKLLLPGLGRGSDQSRAKELLETTANDSQSLLAAMHNTHYLDRSTRPLHPSEMLRWANRLAGGLMLGLTVLAAGWRAPRDPTSEAIFIGALILVMLFVSPVCHLHYFCLAVPLIMALLVSSWDCRSSLHPGWGMVVLLAVNFLGYALPNLPGMEVLRDIALALYPALLLWLVGCVVLWRRVRARRPISLEGTYVSSAAA
jgi:hypothetical protein